MKPSDSLENELKQLIVTTLRLEDIHPQDIDSEQPLFFLTRVWGLILSMV